MRKAPRTVRDRRRPRLSLCMIVKNEEETLERCLKEARPHVDEIVVVDTGSTDHTVAIAGEYADVLDEIEWPNSFSAARNHSLDLASGDFILILDGDEYLEGEEAWERLRAALADPKIACLQLPVLNVMPEGELVSADRLWHERVFLNHPNLRYSGSVHNQIQEAIVAFAERTRRIVSRVEAEIVHVGYALARETMKEKYRPRLTLLEQEVADARDDRYRAYYMYQLGVVHFVLQDFRKALDTFNEIDYAHLIDLNAFYTHMLAAQTALKLREVPSALLHSEGMLARDRNEPVAYLITGYALLSANEIVNGMMMLVEAFNINQTQGTTARFVLNERMCLRAFASMCTRIGLAPYARAFERHLDAETVDARAVHELIEVLKLGLVRYEQNQAA